MSAYSIDERTITRVNNKGKSCAESADISNGHHHIINGQTASSSSGSTIVGGGKVAPHITHLPRPDACLPDGGAAQDGITSSPTDGSWSTPTDTLAIGVTSTRWVRGYYHDSIYYSLGFVPFFFFQITHTIKFFVCSAGTIMILFVIISFTKSFISMPAPCLGASHISVHFLSTFFVRLLSLEVFVIGDCVEI